MAVHHFEGLPIAAQVAVRGLDPQQISNPRRMFSAYGPI